MMDGELTREDVRALASERSPEIRMDIAAKICQRYNSGAFKGNELGIAEQILRFLARDVEVHVRRTLSENLKFNSSLPHDIALGLAQDALAVALPMLEFSEVLTDADLTHIAKSTQELARKLAIGRRAKLSPIVSEALCEGQEINVVRTVVSNKGAQLSERTVAALLDRYAQESSILEALVHHGGISLALVERLVSMVSEQLQEELIAQYNLPRGTLETAIQQTREHATTRIVAQAPVSSVSDEHVKELVNQLDSAGKLSFSMVMRALCLGDIAFFEASLAKLSRIPVANARKLIRDNGPLGFKALYKAADMPESLIEAVKVVLAIALEETDFGTKRGADYQRRIVERVIEQGYDLEIDNMAYLLAIIGKNIHTSEAEH